MNDIKTLQKYRKRGAYLTHEERVRLCKEDSRRYRRMMKLLRKVALVSGIAAVILFIVFGGYLERGFLAVGSEIFVPWIILFAVWIRREDKKERTGR